MVLDPRGRSLGYAAEQRAPIADYPTDLRALWNATARSGVHQPVSPVSFETKGSPATGPGRLAPTATGHSAIGLASWYCNADRSRGPLSICFRGHPDTGGFDAFAAAGPRLRDALGPSWRGSTVRVNGIAVTLIDWCQCYAGETHEKLIDLYKDVFDAASASRGVTISW
jgi:hypothetical protein